VVESNLHVPELSALRLYVYRRPLHPELFRIFLDHKVAGAQYEADLWVLGLGHHVGFHAGGGTITELVTTESDLFSEKELVEKVPLDGRREYRFSLHGDIHYLISAQAEQMSQGVFDQVYGEMVAFGHKCGLFIQFDQWSVQDRAAPFSLIDYDHHPKELCVCTYHAFPARNVLVKTQSVLSLERATNPGDPRSKGSGGPGP